MTQDEIIRMALEAGFGQIAENKYWHPLFERFAALVAYEVGIAQYNNGYEAGQRNERDKQAENLCKCKGCDELFDKSWLDDNGVCASCGWPVWPVKKQAEQEYKCKDHPDAPHGFNRDMSQTYDRYVCDCEFWEPEKPKIYTESELEAAVLAEREACAKVCDVVIVGDEYATALINSYADTIRARGQA